MAELIWVRADTAHRAYTLVDPAPIPADRLDEHGHLWSYDGGGSDPEAPYTCSLCFEPQWRAYNKPCAEAGALEKLNEERAAWIARNRCDGKAEAA